MKTAIIDNVRDMAPIYLEYGHGKPLSQEVGDEVKRAYLSGIRDAIAIFGGAPMGVKISVMEQLGDEFGMTGDAERRSREKTKPDHRTERPFVVNRGPRVK